MNRNKLLLIVAALAGVAIGAAGVLSLATDERSLDPSRIGAESDQLAEAIEALSETLENEIGERQLLAQRIEQLQQEMRNLQQNPDTAGERNPPERFVPPQAIDDRFAEMGFTHQDRESIRRIEATARFRAVELDDIARREGWINTRRYGEEMQALATFDNPVREALGDEGYDRYLYASGRPNRLVVGSVMATSPAEQAGFRRGDVIVRYGGERVYSNMQLVTMRSSGVAGEPVVVEIYRDGQPMRLVLPRGPLGLGAHAESIHPVTNTWQDER